jgi:hypothetical protein
VVVRHEDLAHAQDALLCGRLVEQVARAAGLGDAADLVLDEDELAGRGTHVRHSLPVVADRPHPEQEVGEGEVGDELPVADEQVQPVDVMVGQVGAPAQELAQGRHDPSLCAVGPVRLIGPCRSPDCVVSGPTDRQHDRQRDVTTVVEAAATRS